MSLVLWLPLINDYHNQGLNDYEISTLGTISWPTGGKLSATCFQGGNANQTSNGLRIEDTFTDLLNGNYTVAVWVKPLGNHVHYNGSIFSSGNWNTAKKRWAFGVNQTNTKVDVLCSDYNTYIDCSVPINEWTHLVCTCGNDRVVKLYKNGSYVGSLNRSTSNTFDSDNVFTCIGRESYANGYFSFNGCLQDFRLYDECLSPLEIKRLSQGLVLYYPMNDPYIESSQNLIRSATIVEAIGSVWGGHSVDVSNYDCSSEGVPINICSRLDVTYPVNDSTGGGVSKPIGSSFTVKPSTVYTFSAYLKASDNYAYTHPNFLYYYGDTAGHGIYTSTKKQPVGNGWYRIWNTLTTGENQTSFSPYFYSYPSKSMTYWIGGWQLEEKDHPTPYIEPLNNREDYTVYDCSDFNNNGIIYRYDNTSTIAALTDTPRNTYSTLVQSAAVTHAGAGTTYIAGDASLTTPKELSICFWVNPISAGYGGSYGQGIFCTTAGTNSGTDYLASAMNQYDNGISFNSSDGSTRMRPSFVISEGWHHYAATYDGQTARLYKDGIQTATQSFSTVQMLGSFDHVFFGFSKAGGVWRRNMCKWSDCRLYATALSADDIKALYQNSAYINSNGITYAHEFMET